MSYKMHTGVLTQTLRGVIQQKGRCRPATRLHWQLPPVHRLHTPMTTKTMALQDTSHPNTNNLLKESDVLKKWSTKLNFQQPLGATSGYQKRPQKEAQNEGHGQCVTKFCRSFWGQIPTPKVGPKK